MCSFFYVLDKHWKCPEAFGRVGLQFRREVRIRHILNGVENNTNRSTCRVLVRRWTCHRKVLRGKKKTQTKLHPQPCILDSICLKQKEKTLSRLFYAIDKKFDSMCPASSHCRFRWSRKNLIIKNPVGKYFFALASKNSILSLPYFREDKSIFCT